MAALQVLRTLASSGTPPPCTVTLVADWAHEEGARFGRSLFGSSAVVVTSSTWTSCATCRDAGGEAARGCRSRAHGVELDRASEAQARLQDVAAYLELHIEQGPVLESENLAARRRARDGGSGAAPRDPSRARPAHAGSTPIPVIGATRSWPPRGFALELREDPALPPRRRVHGRTRRLHLCPRASSRRSPAAPLIPRSTSATSTQDTLARMLDPRQGRRRSLTAARRGLPPSSGSACGRSRRSRSTRTLIEDRAGGLPAR